MSIRKNWPQTILIDFLFLSSFAATSAILTAEQPLLAGIYQVPVLVKDSYNRACELPQIVRLEACDCDTNHMCLYSTTPGIYTGASSSVTNDVYGPIPDDRIEGSNVGLGPAGIGMIILGLLLLLCEYWMKSFFSTVLQNKNVNKLTGWLRSFGHFVLVSAATSVEIRK